MKGNFRLDNRKTGIKRKFLTALLMAFVLAFLTLTSCSSSNKNHTEKTPTPSESSATEPAQSPSQTGSKTPIKSQAESSPAVPVKSNEGKAIKPSPKTVLVTPSATVTTKVPDRILLKTEGIRENFPPQPTQKPPNVGKAGVVPPPPGEKQPPVPPDPVDKNSPPVNIFLMPEKVESIKFLTSLAEFYPSYRNQIRKIDETMKEAALKDNMNKALEARDLVEDLKVQVEELRPKVKVSLGSKETQASIAPYGSVLEEMLPPLSTRTKAVNHLIKRAGSTTDKEVFLQGYKDEMRAALLFHKLFEKKLKETLKRYIKTNAAKFPEETGKLKEASAKID